MFVLTMNRTGLRRLGVAALCGVVGSENHTALTESFAQAMGLLLATTGTCCLIQLISTVCFMKGVI